MLWGVAAATTVVLFGCSLFVVWLPLHLPFAVADWQ
jgi:hypothetical protein